MDILFWSGGKDSYLALQFYRKSYPDAKIKLLTTYDKTKGIVPHQRIKMEEVEKQASSLELDLISVPLPPDCSNDLYLEKVKEALENTEGTVEHLVFGDWHQEEIREWRERVFADMGYECVFPIWDKEINELLLELLLKPIEVKISAVKKEFQSLIGVDESYDQSFIRQIQHQPKDIDPMGENGEFHTKVVFKDWDLEQKQPLIP